jgi:hypothetical protein
VATSLALEGLGLVLTTEPATLPACGVTSVLYFGTLIGSILYILCVLFFGTNGLKASILVAYLVGFALPIEVVITYLFSGLTIVLVAPSRVYTGYFLTKLRFKLGPWCLGEMTVLCCTCFDSS